MYDTAETITALIPVSPDAGTVARTALDQAARATTPCVDVMWSLRWNGCVSNADYRSGSIAQGTEFVSTAMDLWAYANAVILDFSRRGKPTDNAAIESFNGRFREECLKVH